jgi:hypothetical protein
VFSHWSDGVVRSLSAGSVEASPRQEWIRGGNHTPSSADPLPRKNLKETLTRSGQCTRRISSPKVSRSQRFNDHLRPVFLALVPTVRHG